jgi:hypothetical protein
MFATLRSTGASSCSNVCTTTTQESGNRRRVSIPAELFFEWNVVSGSCRLSVPSPIKIIAFYRDKQEVIRGALYGVCNIGLWVLASPQNQAMQYKRKQLHYPVGPLVSAPNTLQPSITLLGPFELLTFLMT